MPEPELLEAPDPAAEIPAEAVGAAKAIVGGTVNTGEQDGGLPTDNVAATIDKANGLIQRADEALARPAPPSVDTEAHREGRDFDNFRLLREAQEAREPSEETAIEQSLEDGLDLRGAAAEEQAAPAYPSPDEALDKLAHGESSKKEAPGAVDAPDEIGSARDFQKFVRDGELSTTEITHPRNKMERDMRDTAALEQAVPPYPSPDAGLEKNGAEHQDAMDAFEQGDKDDALKDLAKHEADTNKE